MKGKIMREIEIEKALVKAVKSRGGLCLKFTSPGNSGVPDRIVLLPNGRVAFVEVKAPGRKPRKLQQYWLETLTQFGFPCMVLDHPEQIKEIIQKLTDSNHWLGGDEV